MTLQKLVSIDGIPIWVATPLRMRDIRGRNRSAAMSMERLNRTISKFVADVKLILPAGTTSRLSRAIDVGQRQTQRWVSGADKAPLDVDGFVWHQAELVAEIKPVAELTALVEKWKTAGLHDEVIGSQLAFVYALALGKEIE